VTYGEIGRDFIQVHHVVPVSELGNGYQLDPVTDLVPLCANCHAMAHHGVSTPRTEGELRRVIAAAGFLPGTTVSAAELEAEREAREILGPGK
jgi:5-methylcytosine-specific restriction enzyme A